LLKVGLEENGEDIEEEVDVVNWGRETLEDIEEVGKEEEEERTWCEVGCRELTLREERRLLDNWDSWGEAY
jgi:hypothetical protein